MKKSTALPCLAACACLLGIGGLGAQEPAPDAGDRIDAPLPELVRVQAEFIEVAHPTLTRLMRQPRQGADDTKLREEVAKLVDAGEATVVETMSCIARSGDKATTESIEEFIYPMEYEPSEIPNQIRVEKGVDDPGQLLPELATGPTPTSFEKRNLGSTFEISPNLSEDGKLIDLQMAPEIVYHDRNEVWAEWKDSHGEAPIQMPIMYKLAVNTACTLVDGQPLMVAALSPKGDDGFPDMRRKVMVFVRCDVLIVGK